MTDEVVGKIIVTVESEDHEFEYEELSVSFESTPEEIIEALKDPVLEKTDGVDITEDDIYVVRKSENSGMIYVHPKSPAAL